MPAKMTVLSLAHTGHVLAAIAEPPSGPASLEALIGAAFPLRATRVRNGGGAFHASFALPASLLKLKSIAYDARVIARPQSFAVNGDFAVELPADDVPTVGGLSASAVTADYGSAVAADTKVLVVVRDEIDPRVQRIQAGAILAGEQIADLNLTIVPDGPAATLAAGTDCFVAVAVEGRLLGYSRESTPP
jgi:hypothetical protein